MSNTQREQDTNRDKPQFIYDTNGHAAFVVMPIADYIALAPAAAAALSDEELFDIAMADTEGPSISAANVQRLIDGEHPLRVYRDIADMTQAALANSAGVSVGYISQIERGEKPVAHKLVGKLAAALGCLPADLETDSESAVWTAPGVMIPPDAETGLDLAAGENILLGLTPMFPAASDAPPPTVPRRAIRKTPSGKRT